MKFLIKFQGIFYFTVLLFSSSFVFSSFPQMEKQNYNAKIYENSKKLIGYNENRFDEKTKKRVEKSFDKNKKLIKKSVYHYNDAGNIISTEEYDSNLLLLKKTKYEYSNGNLIREVIKKGQKLHFADFTYSYEKFEGEKKIKYKFINYKDSDGNNLSNLNQKIAYKYYSNGRTKEIFSINFLKNIPEILLEEVQIFRNISNDNTKIQSILRLNNEYIPFRYIEYHYDEYNSIISKIQIFEINGYSDSWNKNFKNIPKKNLKIIYSFEYEYMKENDASKEDDILMQKDPSKIEDYIEEIPREKRKDFKNIDSSIKDKQEPIKKNLNLDFYQSLLENQKKILESQKALIESQEKMVLENFTSE